MNIETKIKLYKFYYIFTIIGTVFHEFAHKSIVESRGLKVKEVSYFSLSGGSLGHVTHEAPRTYNDVFSISIAPFIFNTVFAIVPLSILFGYIQNTHILETPLRSGLLIVICVWFSTSLLLHSFPSSVDLTNIKEATHVLWKNSQLHALQRLIKYISDRHLITKILISPILITLEFIQVGIFAIKHFNIVISLPILYGLKLLNNTKKYGSHHLYTTVTITICWYLITPQMVELYSMILEF